MNNRIEICGAIAAGKTTLASAFAKNNDYAIFEDFSKISMLDDFYSNPSFFSFETEMTFTMQHYYQVKKETGNKKKFFCDFSSVDDYAFASITLNDQEMHIYDQVFSYIQERMGKPQKLIKLLTSTEELICRIHNRGRKNEVRIDSNYLKNFECALEKAIDKYYSDVPTITLNTEKISITEYDSVFLDRLLV